jgi:hypothetical protein
MAFLQPDRGTQSQRTQRKDVVRSGQLFAAGADGNGRDRSLFIWRDRCQRKLSLSGWRCCWPPTVVDAYRSAALRAQGALWREIASKLGVGATTARRAFSRLAKSLPKPRSES